VVPSDPGEAEAAPMYLMISISPRAELRLHPDHKSVSGLGGNRIASPGEDKLR